MNVLQSWMTWQTALALCLMALSAGVAWIRCRKNDYGMMKKKMGISDLFLVAGMFILFYHRLHDVKGDDSYVVLLLAGLFFSARQLIMGSAIKEKEERKSHISQYIRDLRAGYGLMIFLICGVIVMYIC